MIKNTVSLNFADGVFVLMDAGLSLILIHEGLVIKIHLLCIIFPISILCDNLPIFYQWSKKILFVKL